MDDGRLGLEATNLRPRINPTAALPSQASPSTTTQPSSEAQARSTETTAAAINRLAEALTAASQTAGKVVETNSKLAGEAGSAMERGSEKIAATLDRTSQIIREGVEVKLENMSRMDVQIGGLEEAIQAELRPLIEAAATRAAREIVRKALVDVANASDSESANAIRSATRGLA
jgi:hypothetical protein